MDALSEELLLNILQRLPVKSIGICMCVNKSWGSLIKTPSFISSDSKIRNINDQYLFFWGDKNRVELRLDNDTFDSHKLFTLPVHAEDYALFDGNMVCGISVCNGLICFVKYPDIIMLWNPTIHRLLTLPQPMLEAEDIFDCLNTFTLWFDSLTDDYKVIRFIFLLMDVVVTIEQPQVEIFSLNNNSWSNISQIPPLFQIAGPSSPIINDTLNWIGYHDSDIYKWYSILSFDVNAEVFRIIDFPKVLKIKDTSFKLAVYKDTSIAICCHDSIDQAMEVWVMKEYDNIESWTKMWKSDPSHQPLHTVTWRDRRRVIGLLNNGKVLWEESVRRDSDADYKAIISTDLESGLMKEHVVVPNTYYTEDVRYFEESLVLLDNANAVSTLDDNDDE
jgi:F-box interacting protein